MGLSDEERISGLYHNINKMVEYGRSIQEKIDAPKLYERSRLPGLTDKLWHAFLGKNSNSTHWILGSSATNTVVYDTLTPWGEGLRCQCNGIPGKKDSFLETRKRDDEKIYDPFDDYNPLTIYGLLKHNNSINADIHMLYAYSEQVIYYLRRYEDDLLESFSELSKLISDIQGECFSVFKAREDFPKAYILHQICKKLYGPYIPHYPEKFDVVTKWLVRQNLHHGLSAPMTRYDKSLKWLADIHVDMTRKERQKKLTKIDRVLIAMEISGRRFHYEHQYKELIALLKKDRSLKGDAEERLRAQFEACVKEHDDDEKQSRKNYEENCFKELSLYGFIEE